MIRVIMKNSLSKIFGLFLSTAFTLLAPKFVFINNYDKYILLLKIISSFNLILMFGSAGVISRYIPIYKNNKDVVNALINNSISKKYIIIFVGLVISITWYFIFNEIQYFILFLFCSILSFLELSITLFYSLEFYNLKIYNRVSYQISRLILLPLGKVSLLPFLFLTEFLQYIIPVVKIIRTYSFKRISGFFIRPWNSSDITKFIDKKEFKKVELNTYFGTFLFFFLGSFPILVSNYSNISFIKDISIYFVITNTIIFNIINSLNEVILPTLVKNRENNHKIYKFFSISIVIPIIFGIGVVLVFTTIKGIVMEYYELINFSFFYYFLLYSVCMSIANSFRQLYFIYDRMNVFNIILLSYYLCSFLVIIFVEKNSQIQAIVGLFIFATVSLILVFFVSRFNKNEKNLSNI